MPRSPQDVYARHLVSDRGYPLWTPEPNVNLPPDYVGEGLRIGDVGVVVPQDGSFDVFFNICLPEEHPLHEKGVPASFTPIELGRRDIAEYPDAESAGRVISSSSVLRANSTDMLQDPERGTQLAPLSYEFTLSPSDGAALILPEGAERRYVLNDRPFLVQAIQHAVEWYTFAEQRLGRIIDHDSLYLITGFYKARSWSLAAYQQLAGKDEVSAKFKAVQVGEGNVAACYTWETTQAMDWRVGPSDRYYNGVPNQTVFIQGFKIAIRQGILGPKWVDVKADSPTVRPYRAEFSSGSWFSSLWSALSGSSTTSVPNTSKSTGMGTDTAENDSSNEESDIIGDDITVHRVPRVAKLFHPSDIINHLLLQETPSATIAITHDSHWITLLEKGLLKPGEASQNDRLRMEVNENYAIVQERGVVYLQNLQSAMAASDINCDIGVDSGAGNHSAGVRERMSPQNLSGGVKSNAIIQSSLVQNLESDKPGWVPASCDLCRGNPQFPHHHRYQRWSSNPYQQGYESTSDLPNVSGSHDAVVNNSPHRSLSRSQRESYGPMNYVANDPSPYGLSPSCSNEPQQESCACANLIPSIGHHRNSPVSPSPYKGAFGLHRSINESYSGFRSGVTIDASGSNSLIETRLPPVPDNVTLEMKPSAFRPHTPPAWTQSPDPSLPWEHPTAPRHVSVSSSPVASLAMQLATLSTQNTSMPPLNHSDLEAVSPHIQPTVFRCMWWNRMRGTRCNALISGDRHSVSRHLRDAHNLLCDGQKVECAWDECVSEPMQGRNIPRHIVSRHLVVKGGWEKCGRHFGRQDMLRKHSLACRAIPSPNLGESTRSTWEEPILKGARRVFHPHPSPNVMEGVRRPRRGPHAPYTDIGGIVAQPKWVPNPAGADRQSAVSSIEGSPGKTKVLNLYSGASDWPVTPPEVSGQFQRVSNLEVASQLGVGESTRWSRNVGTSSAFQPLSIAQAAAQIYAGRGGSTARG